MIKIEQDFFISYCDNCKLYKLKVPFGRQSLSTALCCDNPHIIIEQLSQILGRSIPPCYTPNIGENK